MQNTRIKMRNKHKNKRRKRRGMTKKWKSKSLGYRYALPEASLLESTSRRRGLKKGRVKQESGGGGCGDSLPPTQLCRGLRSLWQVLSVVGLHILPPNEFSAKYLCACCCCCCGSNKSSSSNSQWSGI